jgi:choline-glycine betaine transporter
VPLSAEEQRRLAELEESLSAEDPGFARTFSRNAPGQKKPGGRRRPPTARTIWSILGIIVGLVLLLVGMELRPIVNIVVSICGFVVMLVSAVTLMSGVQHRGPAKGQGPDKRGSGTHPAGTGRSFTQRMEERWRRRSDGQH